MRLTALLFPEEDGVMAKCAEVDVVSEGRTVEEALANLKEAVELFLEEEAPEGMPRSGAIVAPLEIAFSL